MLAAKYIAGYCETNNFEQIGPKIYSSSCNKWLAFRFAYGENIERNSLNV